VILLYLKQELTDCEATKAGNRLEAQECLQIAAQGGIKVHTQLRRMDELTQVIHIMTRLNEGSQCVNIVQVFEELESGEIQGRAVIDLA
jgi:propanol-preferring alcohol dehydrogenase